MPAKAHHTIPRLHLAHFVGATPPGQVWTYDSLTRRNWSQIPEETGTETHFYSLVNDDGTEDTRIEEMLSGFETRAAPVYEALLQGNVPKLGSQDRVHFAEFLAMQYVRTPAMRKMNAEIESRRLQTASFAYAQNDRMFEKLIERLEAERGEKFDSAAKEQARRDMIDPSNYEIEIPKRMTLKALGAADGIAPILYKMKWSLAHPYNGDGFFITSDNPVGRRTDPRTHHAALGDGGFKNRTLEVSFPLSKEIMMFLSWEMDARELGSLDRKYVDRLNEIRAIDAYRFIYSHSNEAWISELVAKYTDPSKPRIKSFGFGPSKNAKTKVGRK
jgi:hypothetical protein